MKNATLACAALLAAAGACDAEAQVSIQTLPGAWHSCNQVMVSSNSDHVWQIDLSYKYVGKLSDGAPWEHAHVTPITVYPRATYHFLGSGLLDCSKGARLAFSWTGFDFTARAEEQERRTEESRKGVIRGYLEREEEVKRQNERLTQEREAKVEARRQAERDRKAESERVAESAREMQRRVEADRLANERALMNSDPECRALTMEGFRFCQRQKAEERVQRDAAAARDREIENAKRQVDQTSADAAAKAVRDMEANNCAYGAGLPASIPYPKVNTNNERYLADIKRVDAMNAAAQENFHRQVKAASDACEARKAGRQADLQTQAREQAARQQRELAQQQERQRMQAEQRQRLQAQQKAQADLQAAIQEGKKTVNEAERGTQTMKGENADLMNLINKMK